jgi:hypothetical protein
MLLFHNILKNILLSHDLPKIIPSSDLVLTNPNWQFQLGNHPPLLLITCNSRVLKIFKIKLWGVFSTFSQSPGSHFFFAGYIYSQNAILKIESAKIMWCFLKFSIAKIRSKLKKKKKGQMSAYGLSR